MVRREPTFLPLDALRELRLGKVVAKDRKDKCIPAPWFDGLGHTEGLLICLTRANQDVRVPHPLEEVFLVDEGLQLVERGEGFAGHWNPLNTTYFEAFYPGDVYRAVDDDGYYGRGFIYVRRAPLGESECVCPGCSAVVEDLS